MSGLPARGGALDDTWPWAGPDARAVPPRRGEALPAWIGRYRPVRRLRGGPMSEVYVALCDREDGASEVAAVKRIHPNLRHVREARALFAHEAALLDSFDHHGIVRGVDLRAAASEGYFAMELVHGRGLTELVRRAEQYGLRMPVRHAIAIVAGAAEALAHAHAAVDAEQRPLQVVHADVTPGNLMVTHDGVVKVVDFGLARSRRLPAAARTRPNGGTVAYMSPEQCRGEALDRRSDVYALGVILWELVTWSRLYRRLAPEQIIARVAIGAVPLPSMLRADVPAELEDAIMIALQPAPERRFADAASFAALLRRLGGAADPRGLDVWIRRVFH